MNNVAEEWVDKAKEVARIATRRRWLVLGVAASVALVCAVAIDAVPDRYEATARIYVDTQTVLKPLMANITFQPDIDQQVSMLARTLISRPNVEKLVGNPPEVRGFGRKSTRRSRVSPDETDQGRTYRLG